MSAQVASGVSKGGGLRVFITGGASGLGRALAEHYARQGARIGIGDINNARGEETLNALRALGAQAFYITCNVTVEDDLPAFRPRRAMPGLTGRWPTVRGPDGSDVDLSVVPDFGAAAGREMCYLSDFQDGAWYAIASSSRVQVSATRSSTVGLACDGRIAHHM